MTLKTREFFTPRQVHRSMDSDFIVLWTHFGGLHGNHIAKSSWRFATLGRRTRSDRVARRTVGAQVLPELRICTDSLRSRRPGVLSIASCATVRDVVLETSLFGKFSCWIVLCGPFSTRDVGNWLAGCAGWLFLLETGCEAVRATGVRREKISGSGAYCQCNSGPGVA